MFLGAIMIMFVRGRLVRHLYTTIWGVLITYYIYGAQIMNVVFLAGVTYMIMLLSPRKVQHYLVNVFCFSQVTYSHIKTYFFANDTYSLGITTVTMLVVLRLSSLSWCFRDGA